MIEAAIGRITLRLIREAEADASRTSLPASPAPATPGIS